MRVCRYCRNPSIVFKMLKASYTCSIPGNDGDNDCRQYHKYGLEQKILSSSRLQLIEAAASSSASFPQVHPDEGAG